MNKSLQSNDAQVQKCRTVITTADNEKIPLSFQAQNHVDFQVMELPVSKIAYTLASP